VTAAIVLAIVIAVLSDAAVIYILMSALPFPRTFYSLAKAFVSALGAAPPTIQFPPLTVAQVLAYFAQFLISVPIMMYLKRMYFNFRYSVSVFRLIFGYIMLPIIAAIVSSIVINVVVLTLSQGGSQVFIGVILILFILAAIGLGIYGLLKVGGDYARGRLVWELMIMLSQVGTMFFTFLMFDIALFLIASGLILLVLPSIITIALIIFAIGNIVKAVVD
jgi:hypothetical protein